MVQNNFVRNIVQDLKDRDQDNAREALGGEVMQNRISTTVLEARVNQQESRIAGLESSGGGSSGGGGEESGTTDRSRPSF